MQDVQLLDQVLYAGGDQVVGQVVAVDLDDGGHDEQVAAGVEDVLELVGGVDDGGHAVSEDDTVTRMESHAAIQDVQEQLNVLRVSKIASHGLKHSRDQTNPVKFVKDINPL